MKGLRVATIIFAILTFAPILIFCVTHNMHPTSEPGGFGEGYTNIVHVVSYGLIIAPALVGLAICGIIWLIVSVRKK